jgi:hypothetical protein
MIWVLVLLPAGGFVGSAQYRELFKSPATAG